MSDNRPLGEPHKEVWLVQVWDESNGDSTPLFSYAFTDKNVADKVSRRLDHRSGWGYEVSRVVLDAAEDAERVIVEMVAINARENDYYNKEIL